MPGIVYRAVPVSYTHLDVYKRQNAARYRPDEPTIAHCVGSLPRHEDLSLLQYQLVQRQVRYRTPKPRILFLQVLHPPRLVGLQTAIFLAPPIIGEDQRAIGTPFVG